MAISADRLTEIRCSVSRNCTLAESSGTYCADCLCDECLEESAKELLAEVERLAALVEKMKNHELVMELALEGYYAAAMAPPRIYESTGTEPWPWMKVGEDRIAELKAVAREVIKLLHPDLVEQAKEALGE